MKPQRGSSNGYIGIEYGAVVQSSSLLCYGDELIMLTHQDTIGQPWVPGLGSGTKRSPKKKLNQTSPPP
ncbi:uncharacterized protein BO96DRAFT_437885 [Aspergillus niger CBS 101883]|uniref:Uncharacterized protein n=2 Tax=Aspergillus niger TaxID=5061 RepID=A2QLK5_ASPNC|nr:uncharacterized protein BO96DRAFT_437885 [Aspergillus niger CBS 101883]XP_059605290.1 hypothetical protein An06g01560 [Aspergillus niger]PYH52539.1 hypothetical protein BO96DRAFT_437885 [Aspergillus niger CBS 101883]CAK48000.1 hypothetical protein An06g01560 [Aspergillus niger]